MKKMIKLFDPSINQAEKNSVLKVLNSKFWASGSGVGNVLEFEKQFESIYTTRRSKRSLRKYERSLITTKHGETN